MYIVFLFDFINKKCFFNQHGFVFCSGTENRGFSLVSDIIYFIYIIKFTH